VAKRLAGDGAAVAVNYRSNAEKAQALVEEITKAGGEAVAVRADVSDPAQIGRLVDETAER